MVLSKADKGVIAAFTDRRPADSKKLSTDGTALHINGLGGNNVAVWRGEKIHFNDLGSKTSQTVQSAVKRQVPANWLMKSNPGGKSTMAKKAPRKWGTAKNKPWIGVSWSGIAHQCSTKESAKRQAGARGKVMKNTRGVKVGRK